MGSPWRASCYRVVRRRVGSGRGRARELPRRECTQCQTQSFPNDENDFLCARARSLSVCGDAAHLCCVRGPSAPSGNSALWPRKALEIAGASTELPSPGEAYFSTTSKLHIVHARSISKRVKNGHATLDHRTTSEVRVCNILCVCVGACVTSCAENKRGNVSGCMCEHKPEPAYTLL